MMIMWLTEYSSFKMMKLQKGQQQNEMQQVLRMTQSLITSVQCVVILYLEI